MIALGYSAKNILYIKLVVRVILAKRPRKIWSERFLLLSAAYMACKPHFRVYRMKSSLRIQVRRSIG